jgi:hypothetical protein
MGAQYSGPVLAPESLIDQRRYPLLAPDSPRAREALAAGRAEQAERGRAVLPGFLRAEALPPLVAECDALAPHGHFSEVHGTPYIDVPDLSQPEGHPRRTLGRTALTAVAYDRFPLHSGLRALYEWEPLLEWMRLLLGRECLFRYADPFGALNLAVMRASDELAWHYDQTDFVVSIAIQSSEAGGEFEVAPWIRSADDENYAAVARVLGGVPDAGVSIVPMTPGTLMLFEGRRSLHRVSPIRGGRARHVALLAYDTKPGTDSSPLLKRVRYGRLPGEP